MGPEKPRRLVTADWQTSHEINQRTRHLATVNSGLYYCNDDCMNWKQQIEAQIADLRRRYTHGSPVADSLQALLDVAVAADRTVQARHEQSPCEEIRAYYDMSDALDKLREVSDE